MVTFPVAVHRCPATGTKLYSRWRGTNLIYHSTAVTLFRDVFFLRCFDTVGWTAERGIRPAKTALIWQKVVLIYYYLVLYAKESKMPIKSKIFGKFGIIIASS